MYVLFAPDRGAVRAQSTLFERHMEPLLRQLEEVGRRGGLPADLPELPQYLRVCRWPFRKLEYSFALDILLNHLTPGSRFLDAGSGVTPFAHVFAARGVRAEACDGDSRLIARLRAFRPETVYGSAVAYAAQDLTLTSYPDATFDAISCISVLEHIPAPHDQRAIRELLRILKPGGVLVLTVDFSPAVAVKPVGALHHHLGRLADLARRGDLREIGRGVARKVRARRAIAAGVARVPRSANQCFERAHLEQDILPLLAGREIQSQLACVADARAVTPGDSRRFWELEPGLFRNQGGRSVLPAAYAVQKATTSS